MIMAAKARDITDSINSRGAWQILEERIREKALAGEYSFTYDEENEGAKFVEAPKEVCKILEDAGYVVKYQHCADVWSWGRIPTYHRRYVGGWK